MLFLLQQNLTVLHSEPLLEHSYANSDTDAHVLLDLISSLLIFLEGKDQTLIAVHFILSFFLILTVPYTDLIWRHSIPIF